MGIEKGIFTRTELLLGDVLMKKIASQRVIIFGIGGVGSWCAESLVRSGIKSLTIVDSDRVCITNINRQLLATAKTVGQVKVDVLKDRLLEINPDAEINALRQIYSSETSASFHLEEFDYIIDAIDSLSNKMDLIRTATQTKAVLVSSMGAALKMDPTKIKVAEFWKVKGCPLAAALRRKFKKSERPSRKFLCVYSEEVLENKGANKPSETDKSLSLQTQNSTGNTDLENHDWSNVKAQINGTLAHATAIFGFTLAGLVMQSICKEEKITT